jgi:ABC-type phosphate transport system permease subunit
MKIHLLLLIILLSLCLNTQAQFWYSKYYENRNLSELNFKELSFLYEKSNQTTNRGIILTIVGSSMVVVGGSIFISRITKDLGDWEYSGDTFYNIVSIATITGVVVAAIGIPTLIIGSERKKVINNIMKNQTKEISLQIIPLMSYDKSFNNYSAGLLVSLNF